MEPNPIEPAARNRRRTTYVLGGATLLFLGLAAAFLGDLWGHQEPRPTIPLVDRSFLESTPWRRTYSDLVRAKEDMSDFDCYGCHDKKKPVPLPSSRA